MKTIAFCLLLLMGGCYYALTSLPDQAEIIYPGTTIVDTEEANRISDTVTFSGYSNPANGAVAQKGAMESLYWEAGLILHGSRFRRSGTGQVEWLTEEQAKLIPSSQLQVTDLQVFPDLNIFRVQARIRLPRDHQKALAELPAIVAVGHAPVEEKTGVLEAWRKAREVALQQGIQRMAWYRYGSKVPPQLQGTVFIEKYFQDPLAQLPPDQHRLDAVLLILKVRVRLEEPAG